MFLAPFQLILIERKMKSFFPNYYSFEDIFVTQEKVECKVNNKLHQMGFLDPGQDAGDLEVGKIANLPLWYIKELRINNPYFTVIVPEMYKNVYKAVCEAETTHIELGKLHPYFYEYGRYLTPYDRNNIVGKIVSETIRHRVRYLLDIAKNITEDSKPEHRLDDIENKLYETGMKTNKMFADWLKLKSPLISASKLVQEHNKKRKRSYPTTTANDEFSQPSKRITF